jgi:hypothetical protein
MWKSLLGGFRNALRNEVRVRGWNEIRLGRLLIKDNILGCSVARGGTGPATGLYLQHLSAPTGETKIPKGATDDQRIQEKGGGVLPEQRERDWELRLRFRMYDPQIPRHKNFRCAP